MATHPLREEPKWLFSQPIVTVRSSLVAVPLAGESRRRVEAVNGGSTCREGTILDLRQSMRSKITREEVVRRHVGWGDGHIAAQKYHRTHDVDLEDQRNKRAGRTTLSISKHALGGRSFKQFLQVADAIVGPIGALINPDRPRGCCKASTNMEKGLLVWHGVDNTILYSPALVSMFAGLYRQCALLCKAGYAEEILSIVDRREIRRIIDHADGEAALEVVKELRQWIEVPVPRYGYKTNMPFPMGYFSRLEQISRAVSKHGARAVFSKDFLSSWGLTSRSISRRSGAKRGLWAAWGTTKEGSATYQKIAKLSRSRKRSRAAVER